MSYLFISDLHLEDNRPDIAGIFVTWLNSKARNAKALYILGDFFESWIGDDDLTVFHQEIISALKSATDAGLAIYFMHGNRDFLVGNRFLRATGCQLLPEEHLLEIDSTRVLLMHGDTLCTEDTAYLKFRKKARNVFFQKLFLWKSLKTRRQIAANMREKSKAYTSTTPTHIMDVTQAEVERVMQKHKATVLIHGHTHRPDTHQFVLNNTEVKRIVLTPWHDHGYVFDWELQKESMI